MAIKYTPKLVIESSTGIFSVDFSEDSPYWLEIVEKYGDNAHSCLHLIICWIALLVDSPLSLSRDRLSINRFLEDLIDDLFQVVSDFGNLAHELAISLQHGQDGVIIDPFLKDLLNSPVSQDYIIFAKNNDPMVLQYILTFLKFGKKMGYVDDSLDAIALSNWYETEDKLSLHVWPEGLDNLARVMDFIFMDWEHREFPYRHGKGAVAERKVKGADQKNDKFKISTKLAMILRSQFGEFSKGCYFEVQTPTGELIVDDEFCEMSRLIFVPKDISKSRPINMERIANQYVQQGVRNSLEYHMSERSCLGRHVFLRDQTRNQQASAQGSANSKVDTIDLSSASDSVHWELVQRIFPDKIVRLLAIARSKIVEMPDGTHVEVHKHAPMGSALCFPTQSIIYSAIIILATISHAFSRNMFKTGSMADIDIQEAYKYCFKGLDSAHGPAYKLFRVFGDDLACDTRVTSNVMELLKQLCFTVNEEKSFTGTCAYRESCGEHHFDGHTVTPLNYKIKPLSTKIDVNTLSGIIDMANRTSLYGYVNLRKHLIQMALRYPIMGVKQNKDGLNPVLFSADVDSSMSIICEQPRNTHLKRRLWNENGVNPVELIKELPKFSLGEDWASYHNTNTREMYQRDELRSISIGTKRMVERRVEQYPSYYYGLWWSSRYGIEGSRDEVSTDTTAESLGTRPKWRWTAAED